jgi:hypothetical protein
MSDAASRLLTLFLAPVLACASGPQAPPDVAAAPPLPERIMPSDVIPQGPDVVLTPDGLVEIDAPDFDGRFLVLHPRPFLFRYDQMTLMTPTLGYREGVRAFLPHHEDELREHLDRRIRESLSDASGWKVTEQSGPGVLAVEVAVLDLDVRTTGTDPEAREVAVASSEPCTLVLELRDSESWQPLARISEKRVLPAGAYSGGNIDYVRLKSVFDSFAVDIGRSLTTYHTIVKEIQRREEATETQ